MRWSSSLLTRLIAGVVVIVLIVVALTFAVVYRSTGTQLRAEIDRSIQTAAGQLKHAVQQPPRRTQQELLVNARRYAKSQPYTHSALLLFVLVPGVGEVSNHDELFGAQKPDSDETVSEQKEENIEGRLLSRPEIGYSTKPAPDAGILRLFEIRFTASGHSVYAGAGETLASVDDAQSDVAHAFALAGALAIILAALGAFSLGARIVGPIRRSARLAARIDGGDITPRIELPQNASSELHALADALNHMLDRLASAFAAQRAFVADASHELRTPLTVLQGQLELLSAESADSESITRSDFERSEQLMQAELSRLTRLVNDLLFLAQSDREDFLHVASVRLDELVTELWEGLSLIATRRFEIGQHEPITITADPDRLAQALRNLARNAIAHTSEPDGLVRVDVERRGGDTVRITVSDNGPGIEPDQRERIFERFYRSDAARTRTEGGAGLGLAIVQAVVEAHRGTVRVSESRSGGAAFQIELPIDTSADPSA